MAYGGGLWLPPIQNKIMPGTYMHFSSKARPTNIFGERGYVAFAMELPWGATDDLITVEPSDLQKESMELFGLEYTDKRLMSLREALKHAKVAHIYRLNGGGAKATGTEGTLNVESKYQGTGGNDISVVVSNNLEDESKFDVVIKKSDVKVYDKIAVTNAGELNNNPYVVFKGTLQATAGITLKGGTDGEVTAKSHTDFLGKLERKYFNILAYAGKDEAIKKLYISYVERRVNLEGAYFQLVLHDASANSELVIRVGKEQDNNIVYWVAGKEAGCEINQSVSSTIYDGELKPYVEYKQRDLVKAIETGDFVFHEVDGKARVLADINTFTDFSVRKNEDFAQNQVIRVLHQVANDWSTIFNTRYLDKELNDDLGRTALWNDFHNHLLKLQGARAITNVEEKDIVVEPGEAKNAVYALAKIQPILVMNKLYTEVVVA